MQANAEIQGARLLQNLNELKSRHEFIGDARGIGLFVGVELIRGFGSREKATDVAACVKERMRAHRILPGSEGPKNNILKIRPPLTIGAGDVDMITATLDRIPGELG